MSDSVAPQGQAVDSAPTTGQGAPAQAQTAVNSQAASSQSGQPFHRFKDTDGKEVVFNTPSDLEKAWKESTFRHKDYTKKTMEHAENVKKFQKEQEQYKSQREEFEKQKAEIEKMNKILQTRPDIQKLITERAGQPIGPQGVYDRAQQYADEKYGELKKEIEDFKEWKKQQELESQRNEVYSRMKEIDPEFDPNEVNSLLEELSTGDMDPLVKILWDAAKGRKTPSQIEAKIKKNLEGKKSAGMIPGSGNPGAAPKYKNLKEAHEAAQRDLSTG